MEKSWFASWFDSEYYHVLYKNRDDDEAQKFIKKLVQTLNILPRHEVEDLACGKGRHSIYLNSLGINVIGVDLSENSIHFAKQFENETLKFEVHDMREVFAKERFNFVLNLFTSFGYFEKDEDNLKTLAAISESLKPNGIFILDFFNASKVLKNLVAYEIKVIENIHFEISKRADENYIYKEIKFNDKGKSFVFNEKVQHFSFEDFQKLLISSGFEIFATFGNYDLAMFDELSSDRLILACRKLNKLNH